MLWKHGIGVKKTVVVVVLLSMDFRVWVVYLLRHGFNTKRMLWLSSLCLYNGDIKMKAAIFLKMSELVTPMEDVDYNPRDFAHLEFGGGFWSVRPGSHKMSILCRAGLSQSNLWDAYKKCSMDITVLKVKCGDVFVFRCRITDL